MKKHIREICGDLSKLGCQDIQVSNNGHVRIYFVHAGKPLFINVAGTPRVAENERHYALARACRKMGITLPRKPRKSGFGAIRKTARSTILRPTGLSIGPSPLLTLLAHPAAAQARRAYLDSCWSALWRDACRNTCGADSVADACKRDWRRA